MEGARHVDTPMDPGSAKVLMQPPQDEFTKDSIEFYQAIVGVLIWLCHCRPDLDFAVNLASRFLRCAASQKHIDLICTGHIFQYPHGTRDYGLVSDEEDWIPTGCSDADLTGDIKSARSTLSFNTRLGRFGCISSFLERKICTSTGQAENYACVRLCREVIWERGFPQLMPTQNFTDNQGVSTQSKYFANHSVAKHHHNARAFIRQLVCSGVVVGSDVRSGDNCSDIGVKLLLTEPFVRHRHTVMHGPRSPGPTSHKPRASVSNFRASAIGSHIPAYV